MWFTARRDRLAQPSELAQSFLYYSLFRTPGKVGESSRSVLVPVVPEVQRQTQLLPPCSFVGCLQTFPDREAIAASVDKGSIDGKRTKEQ